MRNPTIPTTNEEREKVSAAAGTSSAPFGGTSPRGEGKGERGDGYEPNEVRIAAQRALLEECAASTRRACEEMTRLIDAGKFGHFDAEVQFAWMYTLKNRREMIVGVLKQLDGARPDRAGMTARAEGDRRMRNEE